jgi:hypothetical protein
MDGITVRFVTEGLTEQETQQLDMAVAEASQTLKDSVEQGTPWGLLKGISPTSLAYLVKDGEPLLSNYKKEVYEQLYKGELQEYIVRKEKWSDSTFDRVAWDAHAKVTAGKTKFICKVSLQVMASKFKEHTTLWP